MTRPVPTDPADDEDELRIRWLLRFLRVQTKYDTKIRTVLIQAAEDAVAAITAISQGTTFSARVRTAQIRLTLKDLREVVHELFADLTPIIKDGQAESAQAAVEAFTETDLDYLKRAFAATTARSGVNVERYISGQRKQSSLQVANAIRNVEQRRDYRLSERVYKTRRIADTWVRREVTSGILRGDSALQVAKSVRRSIRPSTPGGVSYAALRLGRTELNNAFHATSIALSQDRPWVEGMVWHLSKVHDYDDQRVPEICETYSGQIFEVNHVPPKPHPQCRCFVTPQLEPFDVFVRHLTAGQYRDWMNNAA